MCPLVLIKGDFLEHTEMLHKPAFIQVIPLNFSKYRSVPHGITTVKSFYLSHNHSRVLNIPQVHLSKNIIYFLNLRHSICLLQISDLHFHSCLCISVKISDDVLSRRLTTLKPRSITVTEVLHLGIVIFTEHNRSLQFTTFCW